MKEFTNIPPVLTSRYLFRPLCQIFTTVKQAYMAVNMNISGRLKEDQVGSTGH